MASPVNVVLDSIAGLGALASLGPLGYETTFSSCVVSPDGRPGTSSI
jgi:hypothetical protein